MTTIIILSLSIVALIIAGLLNGVMDLIEIHNALTRFGYAWSREAMQAAKDRNRDGKISYLESNFPDDVWHRAKAFMNFFIGIAVALPSGFLIYVELSPFVVGFVPALFLLPLIYFLIISSGFLLIYNNTKK